MQHSQAHRYLFTCPKPVNIGREYKRIWVNARMGARGNYGAFEGARRLSETGEGLWCRSNNGMESVDRPGLRERGSPRFPYINPQVVCIQFIHMNFSSPKSGFRVGSWSCRDNRRESDSPLRRDNPKSIVVCEENDESDTMIPLQT